MWISVLNINDVEIMNVNNLIRWRGLVKSKSTTIKGDK